MAELIYIVIFSALMACIALTGSLTLLLPSETLKKLLLPLIAFAAGSLVGGALFHMIPSAIQEMGNSDLVYIWLAVGFFLFFLMEQFLEWHHSHYPTEEQKQPLTYLILIADGLHNLIGGLAIGATFMVDVRLGITAWFAAALHEVPQELGDFAILVHGKWKTSKALLFNFISGLTFLVGGVIAYFLSKNIEIAFLIPFAAGNFLYIAAADLIPEIKKPKNLKHSFIHSTAFLLGLFTLYAVKLLPHH